MSTDSIKNRIYSNFEGNNTVSAVSVAHHIETNMGKWIHVTVVQKEEVYCPADLTGPKAIASKEHSLYIYNPSLDNVEDVSKIPLQSLVCTDQHVLMRIHSLCRFGDSFGSLKCDCGPQLIAAKRAIISNGSGAIIYLEQEGRNAGLCAKSAAYLLDEVSKTPTHETFKQLGLSCNDLRDYQIVVDICSTFGIQKAEIMTNNPKKFDLLVKNGIEVKQKQHSVPASEFNLHYLSTKRDFMGHTILDPHKDMAGCKHIHVANILNKIHEIIDENNVDQFQAIMEQLSANKQ